MGESVWTQRPQRIHRSRAIMRTALLFFTLLAACSAAPQNYGFGRPHGGGRFPNGGGRFTNGGNRFTNGGNRLQGSNVNAQVTSGTANNPNGLNFNGGLALAASQGVSAGGTSINIDHAQAIQQAISIPGPSNFNPYNPYG